MSNTNTVVMEFHVAREARARYQVDEVLFSLTGNVIFANFHAVRVFAQKMNDQRDLVRFIFSQHDHFDADQLIDDVKKAGLQVSRATVGKALAVLGAEGLIVTRPRWGTFVAE